MIRLKGTYRICITLLILLFCSNRLIFAQQNGSTSVLYSATILDRESHEPLPMVIYELPQLHLVSTTDENGQLELRLTKRELSHKLKIKFRCLGYAPFTRQLEPTQSTFITDTIYLNLSSLALDDVVILGEQNGNESGQTTINKQALEYLQPTSLQDLFLLTAGGLVRNPGLHGIEQVRMREVTTSDNSSLGTLLLIDDAPFSNDSNLQGLGNQNQTLMGKTTLNSGLDLRLISVDQIEKVEIIQGIPSVRYGNLTSGVVRLETKASQTPYNLRVQLDPYSKLFAVSKGINFNKKHSLFLGGDYTRSNQSLINPIASFSRLNAMLKYSFIGGGSLGSRYHLSLHYTEAIDGNKFDPEVMTSKEIYKQTYRRLAITNNFSLRPQSKWLYSLEGTLSCSYLHDLVHQEQWIAPTATMVQPVSKVTGEAEGRYLPSSYFSIFETDGRPLSIFAQLRSTHRHSYQALSSLLLLGLEFKYEHNLGKGNVYDPLLPPNPGKALSSRPIAYKDIPATMPLACFVEETLTLPIKAYRLELRAGLRMGQDLNLRHTNYYLAKKWLLEPRAQLSLDLPTAKLGQNSFKSQFYFGLGRHIKYPTLAYLYPNPAYIDFVEANYYHSEESKRLLWVRTYLRDRVNKNLDVNAEWKFDLGCKFSYAGASLVLSLFYHQTDRGYQYRSDVAYLPYNRYTYSGVLAPSKPSLDLFKKEEVDHIGLISYPDNSIKTIKRGVEYTFRLPKIKSLLTNISVQGAYYRTTYGNSLPMAHKPYSFEAGRSYPYVGFYTGQGARTYTRFHSLLRTDTHIPQLKLIFSTNLQCIWFTERQDEPFSNRPNYWYDDQGQRHRGDELDDKDKWQKHLLLTTNSKFFQAERTPLSLSLNLKMTKEFSSKLKVSFFVNNLYSYDPVYETKLKTKHQNKKLPFFGSELRLTL